jgi:phosphoglycerol transferase MdoB-like AlkP superfamily enzyme
MKFTLNNDHQASRLMNTLLSGLLLFALLFLTADLIVKAQHYGLTPDKIMTTLYGNEEVFIDPIPFASLLETVHADIFFAMMTLLTLGAVYGRVGRSKSVRIILINLMMLSALVALAAPLLAYFVSPFWVDIWYVTFITWHVTALLITLIALWRLRYP